MNTTSLYIHIPFCSRKCLFCSFVIAVGQEHRRTEYIKALTCEMKKYQGRKLRTIYFGGGTPSMLDEDHLAMLMNDIRKNFLFDEALEVTLEANPESINPSKAKFLKTLGFTRISLGVQSTNALYLKFLGRNHDAAMAREAYEVLRQAGFDNINLDLMYAFPGQTKEELQEDTRAIAALGGEHLSLYTLTIEPNSRFHAIQLKLDDDQKQAEHYMLIACILNDYGFKQYEISNFSKPGFESIHNKNYWLGHPYIGLGVGAHGFDGKRRYWNTSHLQDYIKKASGQKPVMDGFEDLTDDQRSMEKVLFGLRMNEGIAWDLIPRPKQAQVEAWIKDGFLEREKEKLKTTPQGRLVLDELCSRLI